MKRIYVSSSYKDLVQERRMAADAIRRLNHLAVAMEQYVACDERPVDKCLADVRQCDGYVGILARRYGFIPDNETASITELEYRAAMEAGIPVLLFLLDESIDWPPEFCDPDQTAIQGFRGLATKSRLLARFKDPESLALEITLAIVNNDRLRRGRPIPPLLPYMADRSQQAVELSKAIQSHAQQPRRPLACLVEGDEHQAHEMFLQRIQERMLPHLLKLTPERSSVRTVIFDWPDWCRTKEQTDSHFLFQLDNEKLAAAREEEINRWWSAVQGPVMVEVKLAVEPGQSRFRNQRVLEFQSFWRRWPDLPAGVRLFAFLSIKERLSNRPALVRWFSRLVSGDNRGQGSFDETAAVANGITWAVLPRLEGISQQEAETWAEKDVAEVCRYHPELTNGIDKIFRSHARSRIPMAELAIQLEILLTRHLQTAEGF